MRSCGRAGCEPGPWSFAGSSPLLPRDQPSLPTCKDGQPQQRERRPDMIRSGCTTWVVLVFAFAASSAVNAQDSTVVSVSATLRGPATFVIAKKDVADRERVVSSSILIQNTLLPAL